MNQSYIAAGMLSNLEQSPLLLKIYDILKTIVTGSKH